MAISGAVEAAGEIGKSAVTAVKEVLVGVVVGAKEVLSAALPKPPQSGKKMEEKMTSPQKPGKK